MTKVGGGLGEGDCSCLTGCAVFAWCHGVVFFVFFVVVAVLSIRASLLFFYLSVYCFIFEG